MQICVYVVVVVKAVVVWRISAIFNLALLELNYRLFTLMNMIYDTRITFT